MFIYRSGKFRAHEDEILYMFSAGEMDISGVIEGLLGRISQFVSLSPKCEIAQIYYQNIVEILGLLKPVLDEVVASEISPTEQIGNVLAELDGHIKNSVELINSWHQLSSKLYFVGVSSCTAFMS